MQITTIGFDLAKSVFQIHGIDATGQVVVGKLLRRSQMLPFFAKLPSCLVGMEACGTLHHWARELIKLGHEARRARWSTRPLCCSGVLVGTNRMLALVTASQMASASAASFFCRLT